MAQHQQKLKQVVERIRFLSSNQEKAYVYHGSTNTTRALKFKKNHVVDLSDFGNILDIDVQSQTVICEPNVPMDRLVEATLKYGLVPPVVMEFPGITVGGGISGGAGESSSFKHGLFHNTVLEMEIVLGNGEVVKASREQHSDLFWGVAGALGTLGIITQVKLKLISAKKFVKVEYQTVKNFSQMQEVLTSYAKTTEYDFMEGIMYTAKLGVVILGKMTDISEKPEVIGLNKSWGRWYYKHIQFRLKNKIFCDYFPLRDFLFRYDRGAFWMGEYFFKLFHLPANRLTKWIFNAWLNTRALYRALHSANLAQKYIIQDLCLPASKVWEFCKFLEKHYKIYPLWFIPLKPESQPCQLSFANLPGEALVSIGVYGTSGLINRRELKKNILLSQKLQSLGGRKWFYATNYYSRTEFWKIYNLKWYGRMRTKYSAKNLFPDIFTKLTTNVQSKPEIFKGFFRFLLHKKYLKLKS